MSVHDDLITGVHVQIIMSVHDAIITSVHLDNNTHTITFDRGTEFASFRNLNIRTYFCNPHSPWQKGGNENFNGRLRKYLPKKFDSRKLSQDLLDNIEEKMNNQPRKCLGFRSPVEVFYGRKLQYVALDP